MLLLRVFTCCTEKLEFCSNKHKVNDVPNRIYTDRLLVPFLHWYEDDDHNQVGTDPEDIEARYRRDSMHHTPCHWGQSLDRCVA